MRQYPRSLCLLQRNRDPDTCTKNQHTRLIAALAVEWPSDKLIDLDRLHPTVSSDHVVSCDVNHRKRPQPGKSSIKSNVRLSLATAKF
jgi:hypothetical protein